MAKNSGGPVVESHPGPGPHTDPLLNVPERGPTPPVSIVQMRKPSHQEDHMTDLMSVADVRVRVCCELEVDEVHSRASNISVSFLWK